MENYFLERKQDSDTLIIAFTGNAEGLMIDSFEFFAVTNSLNYNRILLKDPSKRIYLRGIGGEINSFEKLLQKLNSDIKSINPKIVTVIGTSGGGFAAILFGHLLKANFVHAFSPTTQVAAGLMNWKKLRNNYKKLIGYVLRIIVLYLVRPKLKKFLNLKNVLSHYNGITQYNIYVCGGHTKDVLAAEYLKDCQNVRILKQPCDVHNVIRCMVKNQTLFNVLTGDETNTVTK